jgi:LPS sulfotransferase NodH
MYVSLSNVWGRGIHEKEIFEYFSGNVRFPGTKPLFERPLVVLLFSNRSGSNLLAEHLKRSGRFIGFEEIFNFDFLKMVCSDNNIFNFCSYFEGIVLDNKSDDAFFGVKASADQFAMLFRWGTLGMFSSVHLINIERDDFVEQAVSMSIAHQTQSWTSESTSVRVPEFIFDDIEVRFGTFVAELAARRAIIQTTQMPSLTVRYDDLVKRPEITVQECCSFLGTLPKGVFTPNTILQKQSGPLNIEFTQRFRTEALERVMLI